MSCYECLADCCTACLDFLSGGNNKPKRRSYSSGQGPSKKNGKDIEQGLHHSDPNHQVDMSPKRRNKKNRSAQISTCDVNNENSTSETDHRDAKDSTSGNQTPIVTQPKKISGAPNSSGGSLSPEMINNSSRLPRQKTNNNSTTVNPQKVLRNDITPHRTPESFNSDSIVRLEPKLMIDYDKLNRIRQQSINEIANSFIEKPSDNGITNSCLGIHVEQTQTRKDINSGRPISQEHKGNRYHQSHLHENTNYANSRQPPTQEQVNINRHYPGKPINSNISPNPPERSSNNTNFMQQPKYTYINIMGDHGHPQTSKQNTKGPPSSFNADPHQSSSRGSLHFYPPLQPQKQMEIGIYSQSHQHESGRRQQNYTNNIDQASGYDALEKVKNSNDGCIPNINATFRPQEVINNDNVILGVSSKGMEGHVTHVNDDECWKSKLEHGRDNRSISNVLDSSMHSESWENYSGQHQQNYISNIDNNQTTGYGQMQTIGDTDAGRIPNTNKSQGSQGHQKQKLERDTDVKSTSGAGVSNNNAHKQPVQQDRPNTQIPQQQQQIMNNPATYSPQSSPHIQQQININDNSSKQTHDIGNRHPRHSSRNNLEVKAGRNHQPPPPQNWTGTANKPYDSIQKDMNDNTTHSQQNVDDNVAHGLTVPSSSNDDTQGIQRMQARENNKSDSTLSKGSDSELRRTPIKSTSYISDMSIQQQRNSQTQTYDISVVHPHYSPPNHLESTIENNYPPQPPPNWIETSNDRTQKDTSDNTVTHSLRDISDNRTILESRELNCEERRTTIDANEEYNSLLPELEDNTEKSSKYTGIEYSEPQPSINPLELPEKDINDNGLQNFGIHNNNIHVSETISLTLQNIIDLSMDFDKSKQHCLQKIDKTNVDQYAPEASGIVVQHSIDPTQITASSYSQLQKEEDDNSESHPHDQNNDNGPCRNDIDSTKYSTNRIQLPKPQAQIIASDYSLLERQKDYHNNLPQPPYNWIGGTSTKGGLTQKEIRDVSPPVTASNDFESLQGWSILVDVGNNDGVVQGNQQTKEGDIDEGGIVSVSRGSDSEVQTQTESIHSRAEHDNNNVDCEQLETPDNTHYHIPSQQQINPFQKSWGDRHDNEGYRQDITVHEADTRSNDNESHLDHQSELNRNEQATSATERRHSQTNPHEIANPSRAVKNEERSGLRFPQKRKVSDGEPCTSNVTTDDTREYGRLEVSDDTNVARYDEDETNNSIVITIVTNKSNRYELADIIENIYNTFHENKEILTKYELRNMKTIFDILAKCKMFEDKIDSFDGIFDDQQFYYLDENLQRNIERLDRVDPDDSEVLTDLRRSAVRSIYTVIEKLEKKANVKG